MEGHGLSGVTLGPMETNPSKQTHTPRKAAVSCTDTLRGPHFEQEPETHTAAACAKPTSTEPARWEDRQLAPFSLKLCCSLECLNFLSSSKALCWQAGMLPLLFQLSIIKTTIPQSGLLKARLQLHQNIPQRLGFSSVSRAGAISLSRACTDGDAAQNRSSALVVAFT